MPGLDDEPDLDASQPLPVDPDVEGVAAVALPSGLHPHRRAQRTILLVIGCAGVVGALARYAMGRLITVPAGQFPWSTFWINVTGALIIGFVLILLNERFPRARLARPLIATGFLGAYTTFSTYMVDADLLFKARDIATGLVYAFGSLGAGGAAASIGVVAARFVVRLEHGLNEQLS
jgi:fluoride exporter